jgi:serine/threonine protein phosphatase PrpC
MINSESILDYKNDVASLTDVGKVREANEDNLGFAQTPNGDVFVVCDGMGGHVGGQVASTIAVESVIEYFSSEEKPNIFIAINEAIIYANRRIIEKWAEQPELKGMGTTLVLIVIQNGELYLGHVGDSRAYLFTDDKLHRITKDHSYVQGLVDMLFYVRYKKNLYYVIASHAMINMIVIYFM